ncbi:MAG: DUF1993 domain-containing protein [Pseudomonadota bacterium]
MTLTMHSVSLPVFVKMLGNLSRWLAQAEAHAAAKKFDVSVLLNARLAPDMLPLLRQVQIACDSAKFGIARLAGDEAPKMDDTEASVADLQARIQRTLAYIQSVAAERVVGSETRDVQVPMRGRAALAFKGDAYLQHFVLPNFFFHLTTVYALLRHNGVELGKADFLGLS